MQTPRYNQNRLIRHNLDRFLAPLPDGLSPLERLSWSAPLLPPAMALIIGICIQSFFGFSISAGVSLAMTAVVLCLLNSFLHRYSTRTAMVYFSATILVFVAVGMLRYTAATTPCANHISRLAGTERRLATLEGAVISPVHHTERTGWAFARYFPTPPQSSFYLSVQSLHTPDGPIDAAGHVRVQVAEIAAHINQGDRVRLYCWLAPFDGPANPGQFDMRRYMHRRRVWLSASVPAAEGVEVLAHGQDGLVALVRQRVKVFASGALFEEADYSDHSASLAAALLLGDRGNLDTATYAAFQRTGLAHFISLSGMHIGILAGSLWLFTKYLGLPKQARAILCIGVLLAYGLIVPPRPPTLRAIFLACFFLASVLINRRTRPLNTLALSAIVLLMHRPADVFSTSWQLSFSTVLGILLLYAPLYQRLASGSFFKAIELLPKRRVESRAAQILFGFSETVVKLLAVGLAAWLGGAGFLLYHFYAVNPLATVWTVLAMPFVLVILYAGYLKIALAPFLPTAALLGAVAMDYGCRGLYAVVDLFSHVRFSELRIGAVSVWTVLAGYAVLLTIRYAPQRTAVRLSLAVLVLGGSLAWRHHHNGRQELTLTCLSVGHGLAVAVSFPDRTRWLIDAGSMSQKDPGGRVVLPYWRYRGAAGLNAAVITHADMDHINGLPEVAAALPTRRVYANAGVFDKAQKPSSASFLMQCLETAGHTLTPIEQLDALPDTAAVKMLWPDEAAARDPLLNDNEKSQVIWIGYAGRGMLLCGDIEGVAQNAIIKQYPTLHVDVMLLPHHGSMTTLNPAFVEAFSPHIVIASCAAGRVANALAPPPDSGITAFYTPIDGAVTVNIKADGTLSAVGFKSQKTVRLY